MKKHLIIVSVISVILAVVFAYLAMHTDIIPRPASLERQSIDNFFKILFGIASVFFALIITVFVYSLIFFRASPGDRGNGRPFKGYSPLEFAWTLIPLIIVVVLAVYGGIVLNQMIKAGPPGSELEIQVTAQRFSWEFYYPAENITAYELHIPVNQRIHLTMQSKDVVHSFWVQEWGPKQDIVPGMTTQVRYTPTQVGQYLVECSQLCGYGHTYMTAPVYVTSQADYQTWIQQQKAKATPTTSPTVSTPPTATTSPSAASLNIDLTAQNLAFNMDTINVPAGGQITVKFTNMDSMPHNFSIYTDSTATTAIFQGQIISGSSAAVYKFTAPAKAGNYFFRCDVHPQQMTGQFIVQ